MESQNYDNFGHATNRRTCSDQGLHQVDSSNHPTCTEIEINTFGDVYQNIRRLEVGLQYCDKSLETRALLGTGDCQHSDDRSYGDSCLTEMKCDCAQTSEDDSQSIQNNGQDMESINDGSEQTEECATAVRTQEPIIIYHWTYKNYLCLEFVKEFNRNRFWLNHFEFVDFTIFEYGDRAYYHMWRTFSLSVTFLLGFYVFYPGINGAPNATPYSGFIFMHCWIHILLICHSMLEVASLSWSMYSMASPVVARVHYTPLQFQMIWFLYNTLYPNLMSCNFMYYVVITDIAKFIGDFRICTAVLASFVSIQISVSAIPSRLAHIVHPLGFNILYIVFTMSYQIAGFTNPAGANYVYQEIDWRQSGLLAVCYSFIWIFMTCMCHVLIVACSWCRRLVYRYKRTKISKCVYGISPDEYYFSDDSDSSVHDKFQHAFTERFRNRSARR